MTPEIRQQLKGILLRHESCKLFPYTDSTGHGHLTIGVGRNLSDRGISQPEAIQMLENDIDYFYNKLFDMFDWFRKLDNVRQIVLVDMCFNLGIRGLLEFTDMLSALQRGDYVGASNEILNSLAAKQCQNRYEDNSEIMLTGKI